jgi:hypothetical protein
MNARSTAARRTIRERSIATRLTASLRRGRSLATHALAAGLDNETAKGIANGLRSVAKRLHITPVRMTRTPRTLDGRDGRSRKVGHYTSAQVRLLVANYKPRKPALIVAAYRLAA